MIHLRQAVVVEGRYDKAKLASILDAGDYRDRRVPDLQG